MAKKSKKAREVVEVTTPVEEETMNTETVEETVAVEEVEAATADTDADIENTLDDGEDEEHETSTDEKVRKPRGKRQIIFNCAANVTLPEDVAERNLKAGQTALMLEQIPVTMPAENMEFDVAKGRAEAIEIFTSKYSVAPEMVLGPYYIRKGIGSAPRKRETINVTVAKEAPFTAEPRGNAIHRFKDLDWHVLVNFTEKSDTVFVFYDKLVDPKQVKEKDKAKLQKPTPKFLPISALRDLTRPGASA